VDGVGSAGAGEKGSKIEEGENLREMDGDISHEMNLRTKASTLE